MRLLKYVLVAALTAAPALAIAQTPAPAQQNLTLRHRAFNQQRRIASGLRTGRIHAGQAVRLERQQRSIHRQMQRMRARHNGRLTMRNRRILMHRQNAASGRIFRAKHNRIG